MTPENSPHLDLEITLDVLNKADIMGLDDHSILKLMREIKSASTKSILVRDIKQFYIRDFFCRFVDGWTVDSFGNKFHHIHGKLHDGPNGEPAVLEADGTTQRFRNGNLHDGVNGEPAVVFPDGSVRRYQNGLLTDGPNGEPAIVYPDGTVEYYEDGVRQYKAQPINNKRRQ
jgi:hypothetical protein